MVTIYHAPIVILDSMLEPTQYRFKITLFGIPIYEDGKWFSSIKRKIKSLFRKDKLSSDLRQPKLNEDER